MTLGPEPVFTREARLDEVAVIKRAWLHDYEHAPFGALFSPHEFRSSWSPIIDTLVARSRVLVLCPEDSPEAVFYGWCVFEPRAHLRPILHYLLVRAKSRRLGYASTLLKVVAPGAQELLLSHPTAEARRIARRWAEETAAATGRCAECSQPLTENRSASSAVVTWQCRRKPTPGKPPCVVMAYQPKAFRPAVRPRLVFNPTLV